jgi:hypothetical protein
MALQLDVYHVIIKPQQSMKQRFGEWIRPCLQLKKGEDVSLNWVHYMQLTSGPLPPLDTWTVVFYSRGGQCNWGARTAPGAAAVAEQQQQQ